MDTTGQLSKLLMPGPTPSDPGIIRLGEEGPDISIYENHEYLLINCFHSAERAR